MKKKKGFTLIELLAVIIILAIVALIATPIVLNVIEDAKLSSGMSESQIIVGGINSYCEQEKLKESLDSNYVKKCVPGLTVENAKELVNLGKSDIKEITYNGSKVTHIIIESNNHTFTMCPNGKFVNEKETCPKEELAGISFNEVIEKFPELKLEKDPVELEKNPEKGCAVPSEKNYSYMGGCYLKGKPTNNSIWYSGFLWRIMGINKDGTIRMITDENVTTIPWGAENTAQNWDSSHAKDWLNAYFYPKLKGNDIIVPQQFCSETTSNSSSTRTTCVNNLSKEKSNVGFISIDEYNLAGGSNSYLNIGQTQWTMTPYSASDALYVYSNGSAYNDNVSSAYGLRVVINVNSNTTITSGNGTLGEIWNQETGPYVLNEDKNIEIKGTLTDKTTVGEYVELAGHKYRVVDKTDKGVKLILDGYYEEPLGTVFRMKYGPNNVFTLNSGDGQELNIGQKLNIAVLTYLGLNIDEQNKLSTEYKWFQAEFKYGDKYDMAFKTNNVVNENVLVGLPTIGEILSSQSSSILTKGYTVESSYSNVPSYWTMNPYQTYNSSIAWVVSYGGDAYDHSVLCTSGLRAVIVVKSNITVTGGNGTWYKPYKI